MYYSPMCECTGPMTLSDSLSTCISFFCVTVTISVSNNF